MGEPPPGGAHCGLLGHVIFLARSGAGQQGAQGPVCQAEAGTFCQEGHCTRAHGVETGMEGPTRTPEVWVQATLLSHHPGLLCFPGEGKEWNCSHLMPGHRQPCEPLVAGPAERIGSWAAVPDPWHVRSDR